MPSWWRASRRGARRRTPARRSRDLPRHARRRAPRASPDSRLRRGIEPSARHVDAEIDQRDAGLAVDQQVGAGEPGDARRHARPPRAKATEEDARGPRRRGATAPARSSVTAKARARRSGVRSRPSSAGRYTTPATRIRQQVAGGGFAHVVAGSPAASMRVFPVEEADIVQRLGRRPARSPAPPSTPAGGPIGRAPACAPAPALRRWVRPVRAA